MRPAGPLDALLFILALGGFLALLLAAGQVGGAPWLGAAAPIWFIAATLLRFVLMTAAGGGPATASSDRAQSQTRPSAPPWG